MKRHRPIDSSWLLILCVHVCFYALVSCTSDQSIEFESSIHDFPAKLHNQTMTHLLSDDTTPPDLLIPRRRLVEKDQQGEEKEEAEEGKDQEEAEEEEEDEDSDFLYGEKGYPVIDYHSDGSVDPMHPPFLFSPKNGPRMVEFYAVWCPHCQHFRNHYIQVARQVQTIVKDQNLGEVKVYAVACNLYKDVCKHFDIKGYPQIKLFKANSTAVAGSVNYWEIHAFDILSALGVQPQQTEKREVMSVENSKKELSRTNRLRNKAGKVSEEKEKEALQQSRRTKEDVFNDAYLSFDFSLRNGIFMSNKALSNETAAAFFNWLELLKRSTPPTWKIQPVLAGLLKQFDKIVLSERDLLEVLDKFPPPPSRKFSQACVKGVKGGGFTCGLWQLFHIATLGVVEWNLMVYEGDHLILSTEEASRRIRDFIENFFACDVCRANFVKAYDSCALDRCHRLREPDDPEAENSQEEFIELPLWLFETHNAVNQRLMKEKAEREQTTWTHEDEVKSQWPSKADCPRCWREDNAWDSQMVYKYLRTEYWPDDGVADLYRTSLNEPLDSDDDNVPTATTIPPFFLTLVVSILATVAIGIGWFMKKQERRRSGRHKRLE